MTLYTIHDDFDEFDFPENSDLGDLFENITTTTFGRGLVFAIIETTTISNVAGVGTTHIIAYKNRQYIEETIHPQYLAVIDEIAKNPPIGSPSKYFNWYQRSKYYYAYGENESDVTIEHSTLTPNTMTLEKHDKKKSAEKYILEYPRKLTKTELDKFFEKYVKSLLANDWFREAPYYFVLVKPISVKHDGGSYIALGNLYLKVGTKTKIDLEEYKKYVSLIQAAWFKKFGAKILEEHSRKKVSDEYKPKAVLSKALANRLEKPVGWNGEKHMSLNDFFYNAFDSGAFCHLKDEYLMSISHPLIAQLVKFPKNKEEIILAIEGRYDDKNHPLNILNKTAYKSRALKTLDENSIKYFFLLLSKRRLALALLLIFDFTLEEVHKVLKFGERQTKASYSVKDHTDYLNNSLFIMHTKPITHIIPVLADRDRRFLEDIVKQIKNNFQDFTCKLPVISSES